MTKRGPARASTVGRGKAIVLASAPRESVFDDGEVRLELGDSLERYAEWPSPRAIVSDGAYGVLGFEGDTSDHLDVPNWYEPHVLAWSRASTPETTLWFWNSEIGWAAAHPVLERHGFRYVSCNIWDKGTRHVAGNVNTGTIRRFPVVTEVCAHYVREARVGGEPLKVWLREEWRRTGLPLRMANVACGVKDAAVRKYLDQSHLWYFPPPDALAKLAAYANEHGEPRGKPYFSLDGQTPATEIAWAKMRAKFSCPHGVTNVWQRPPARDGERIKTTAGRAAHLNQKPLDLMKRIVLSSTEPGDVVWEPFGGLFSASLAARELGRRAFAAELDSTYFQLGVARFGK